MEKKHNIALIGFRTTGKSLTGRVLAEQLGWSFLDMDSELVASFGCDIDAWVKAHGWESFRDAESKLLESLTLRRHLVVATGGGVILREPNRQILKEHFHVIWLQATAETIHARTLKDPKTPANRPALTDLPLQEEISRLLEDRLPLYAEAADFALSTDHASPTELTSAIKARLGTG